MPLSITQEKSLIRLVKEVGGIHNLDIHEAANGNCYVFGKRNTLERKCVYNQFNYWKKLPAEKLSKKLNKYEEETTTNLSLDFSQKQQ